MKRPAKSAVILSVTAVVAASLVLSLSFRAIDQPIAFNHRVHVEDLGAECTDCHLYARTGVRATIPNFKACADCHEEALTESQEEARLIEHVQSESPIRWRKVYWVPEHVYFSHIRHTAVAEIECEVCHGAVGEREEPVTRQLVEITMDGCILCHEEKGATNDCIACHR